MDIRSELFKEPQLVGEKKYRQLTATKKTGWIYRRSKHALEYRTDGDFIYTVDLYHCGSGDAILDWLYQVLRKSWCNAQCFYELAQAIKLILDPQANFVSDTLDTEEKAKVRGILEKVRQQYGVKQRR